jgi:NitT/TauT family transport system substrate-binding protein
MAMIFIVAPLHLVATVLAAHCIPGRMTVTWRGRLARLRFAGACATIPARDMEREAMKTLVLETTAPFQGLPELVADDEGLFEKEGLRIEWVDRDEGVATKPVDRGLTDAKGANPFESHGRLFEQGKADMYNACEWGNYCRVQDSRAGSRQVGRRAIVTYAAIVVAPDSPVYTPQQLANRTVAVPFYFGTHYLTLHMLEGFLQRDEIKLCRAPNGSRNRLAALMRGEVDATTLAEPHLTVAEKKGFRPVCSAFYHGTEVASDRVDAETYAAFNRAVREAVRRINADKRAYLHYFIDYYADKDPEIAALTIDDLRESRLVVVDPAPIPLDEMQRTYAWLKSWGMLEATTSPLQLVDMQVQRHAHRAAE